MNMYFVKTSTGGKFGINSYGNRKFIEEFPKSNKGW